MTIYLGADHRGFEMKERLKKWLEERGYQVEDKGAYALASQDDYVDFAAQVAEDVSSNSSSRGIVLCGSGVGVDITSNKYKGVRCGLGFSKEQIQAARKDDDINILALPVDFLEEQTLYTITEQFLSTPFSNEERHLRRIAKIATLEEKA